MYGPGSSKKMESAGKRHTTGKKRGRCRHSPISSLKITLITNGTLKYCCPAIFFFSPRFQKKVLLMVNRTLGCGPLDVTLLCNNRIGQVHGGERQTEKQRKGKKKG